MLVNLQMSRSAGHSGFGTGPLGSAHETTRTQYYEYAYGKYGRAYAGVPSCHLVPFWLKHADQEACPDASFHRHVLTKTRTKHSTRQNLRIFWLKSTMRILTAKHGVQTQKKRCSHASHATIICSQVHGFLAPSRV